MWMKQLVALLGIIVGITSAQLVDNFVCPDEYEGYYPHLYSCDKYWKCIDGRESLETCGNGLAFDDLDPTFTTENCDYLYNVDCGNRTELEPPITAPNCPRLYGTFMDPDDCTAFYNCRNGNANRYSCAPGLAYDPSDRVCKWADQVSRCKKMMDEEEAAGVFKCPSTSIRGIYSKHPHPQDCRQYFVCISGSAREYGCPLGSVFKITQNEDGVCADPSDVAECANYYGDLEFQPEELVKAGVDPEAVGIKVNSGAARTRTSNRVSNTFTELQLPADDFSVDSFRSQNIPSDIIEDQRILVPAKPLPSRFRPKPAPTTTTTTTTTTRRPTTTTTTTRRTTTTTETTTRPNLQTIEINDDIGDSDRPKPAVVKAGEDYYYYYYYYDDDEEEA